MKNFKLVDVDLWYNDEAGSCTTAELPAITRSYLCAVGRYDENNKECRDTDEDVFYWFDSDEELEAAKEYDEGAEFTVVGYTFRENFSYA